MSTTFEQMTIDMIEGRLSPDEYARRMNDCPALVDWLQSCVPEGETMARSVPSTFPELTAAELPAAEHEAISAAVEALRRDPDEPALAALLPLLNEAGRRIAQCTTLVFHLARTHAAILDGSLPCSEAQRRTLPGTMLEAIDAPCERTVYVPYDVRAIWAELQEDSRPGTLSARLNLHGWITDMLERYRPDLSFTPDDSLEKLHDLLLTACPDCVDGPEVWASGILEQLIAELPEGLRRPHRVKLLKERIAQAFHLAPKAKRPRWLQNPDWPVHEGRPMRFLRTEKQHGGEKLLHHFIDDETGMERVVEDAT